jgi:acyl-CoA synthetase (AMP-forming)/AMP-acid ligase II
MRLLSPVAFLQRPVRWLQAIARSGATVSGGPNFAFDLCARRVTPEQRASLDLSAWSVAYTGAEPIRPDTLERFAEAFAPCGFRREAFFPCYGMAEATLMVSGGPRGGGLRVSAFEPDALAHNRVETPAVDGSAGRALASSGQVWPEAEVAIVDADSRKRCGPDEVGEIWVASAGVGEGYWERPEESEATFDGRLADSDEGPYLRTGDLGFVRDGHLYVTGRIKDLIIWKGENRYPQDLERTAELSHPAVRPGGCAAFALERGNREEVVVLAEVDRQYQRAHRALDTAPIRLALRHAIANEHGVQVHTVVLLKAGTLPMTSSGKIQRHACRAAYLANSLTDLED